MSILNERLGKIFGLKKKQNRTQKKRRLQIETLEERQMLAVTVTEYDLPDEPEFYDAAPPEDFEPVFEEEIDSTVMDDVYGELTFDQFYQLHQNIGLYQQLSGSLVYGPMTQAAWSTLTLGVQTLGGPSHAPQNSPGGGTSEYVNIYIVDTLDDIVNANDGVLSLREAVALTNGSSGHDLITFAEGLEGTITLGGTQLALTDSVDIIASGQITISGNDQSRIFYSATSNRTITLEGLNLTNGYTTGSGGAVVFSYVDATLRDVVIKDSVAATSGGGVYASYTTNLAIENSLITGNSASETSGYGGGFYVIYCSGDVAITDSVIENNIARYGGGIALHTNVQNTITGTIIHNNTAGAGGGVYATRTSSETHLSKTNDITITDSQITGNTSINSAGGGIFHYSENISIEDSVISGNVSGTFAGGLYFYSIGESVVSGSTVEGNSATTYGGGIVSNRVTSGIFLDLPNDITITDTSITGNTAGTYSGGAVFHYSENVTLADSLISGNTSGSYAAGLFFYSTDESLVTGCTIEGNRAVTSWGGGVGASRTTTTTSVFYNLANEVTIADTTIANNEAATHGGGIYVTNSSTVTLDSSLLADNIARNKGGGLYATGTGSVNLVNSTVSGNKAETASGQTSTNEGGGIYVGTFAIPLSITNSTITNNTAYLGGGIRTATGTSPYQMNNTIVAGNTVSANSRGHDIYGAFLATSKNNLIGINTGLTGPTNGSNGNLIGTAAVPLDAKLSPLRDNGGVTWTHALLPDSPAIDAGDDLIVDNIILYDQRGLNRIFGDSVDIGACEYSSILRLTVDDEYETVVVSGVTEVSFATGEYGEQQSLGFWITNDGTEDLEIDFLHAELPDGVSFYELPTAPIESGHSEYFEIVWDGKTPTWAGLLRLPSNDPEHPGFVVRLSGSTEPVTDPGRDNLIMVLEGTVSATLDLAMLFADMETDDTNPLFFTIVDILDPEMVSAVIDDETLEVTFQSQECAETEIIVRATDAGGNTLLRKVHVVVTDELLPELNNDTYQVTQDGVLTIENVSDGVLRNDYDQKTSRNLVPHLVEVELVPNKGTSHGTLTLHEDGTFEYTPNTGYTGFDSFSYQVILPDETVSDEITVDLFVVPKREANTIDSNDPNYAQQMVQNDSYTVLSNATIDLDVLMNDAVGLTITGITSSDPDLLEVVQAEGAHGLSDHIRFNSATNAQQVTLTYTAVDGQNNSKTGTVTINVVPVNELQNPEFTENGFSSSELAGNFSATYTTTNPFTDGNFSGTETEIVTITSYQLPGVGNYYYSQTTTIIVDISRPGGFFSSKYSETVSTYQNNGTQRVYQSVDYSESSSGSVTIDENGISGVLTYSKSNGTSFSLLGIYTANTVSEVERSVVTASSDISFEGRFFIRSLTFSYDSQVQLSETTDVVSSAKNEYFKDSSTESMISSGKSQASQESIVSSNYSYGMPLAVALIYVPGMSPQRGYNRVDGSQYFSHSEVVSTDYLVSGVSNTSGTTITGNADIAITAREFSWISEEQIYLLPGSELENNDSSTKITSISGKRTTVEDDVFKQETNCSLSLGNDNEWQVTSGSSTLTGLSRSDISEDQTTTFTTRETQTVTDDQNNVVGTTSISMDGTTETSVNDRVLTTIDVGETFASNQWKSNNSTVDTDFSTTQTSSTTGAGKFSTTETGGTSIQGDFWCYSDSRFNADGSINSSSNANGVWSDTGSMTSTDSASDSMYFAYGGSVHLSNDGGVKTTARISYTESLSSNSETETSSDLVDGEWEIVSGSGMITSNYDQGQSINGTSTGNSGSSTSGTSKTTFYSYEGTGVSTEETLSYVSGNWATTDTQEYLTSTAREGFTQTSQMNQGNNRYSFINTERTSDTAYIQVDDSNAPANGKATSSFFSSLTESYRIGDELNYDDVHERSTSQSNVYMALVPDGSAIPPGDPNGDISLEGYEWEITGGNAHDFSVISIVSVRQTENGSRAKKNNFSDNTRYNLAQVAPSGSGGGNETQWEWKPVSGESTYSYGDNIKNKFEETTDVQVVLAGKTLTGKEITKEEISYTSDFTVTRTVSNGEFTYSGSGSETFKGRSEVSVVCSAKSNDGNFYNDSDWTSYSRTLTHTLPEGSGSNSEEAWTLTGSGSSGGGNRWSFKIEEETESPYNSTLSTGCIVSGTQKTTLDNSGSYSASYSGEESYNSQSEVWALTSGSGSGSGSVTGTSGIGIDATRTMSQQVIFVTLGLEYYTVDGDYSYSNEHTARKTFNLNYYVDNGAWETDTQIIDYRAVESDYHSSISNPGQGEHAYKNKYFDEINVKSFSSDSKTYFNGNLVSGKKVSENGETKSRTFDHYGASTMSSPLIFHDFRSEFQHRSVDQVENYNPVTEQYDVVKFEALCLGNGNKYWDNFYQSNGQWLVNTHFVSAYDYIGTWNPTTKQFDIDNIANQSVTWQTGSTPGKSGPNLVDHLFHATGFYGETYPPTFCPSSPGTAAPPPALVDVVMSDGNASFGTVDFSDLDVTLPEINNVVPTPPPVPSLSDYIVPQQTIGEGFLSGLKAGAGESLYKASLPVAWVSGNSEFETLRDYRDQAWIDSGLDGTKTQYYTQVSANIGVGAGYGAVTAITVRAAVSQIAGKGATFVERMSPSEAARYRAYWSNYAPKNVEPGIRRLDFSRISNRTGRIENSRVIYDKFGRQNYRIDFTDHMRPSAHTNPHLHESIFRGAPHDPPTIEILHNLNTL